MLGKIILSNTAIYIIVLRFLVISLLVFVKSGNNLKPDIMLRPLLSLMLFTLFFYSCSSKDEILLLPQEKASDSISITPPTAGKDTVISKPQVPADTLKPAPTPVISPAPSPAPVVVSNDDKFNIYFKLSFPGNTTGSYKETEWSADWNNPNWANHSNGYGKIIQENENKFLALNFAAGSFDVSGGYQWQAKLARGFDELYFSYRIKFSSGFASTDLQGKLPGLSGGSSNSGGYLPTGMDGWSARYMFWGTQIKFYSYYPDLYKIYGDSKPVSGKNYYGYGPVLEPGFTLKTDTWYTVTQRIVMNTPGKANGLVEGFINGKLCTVQTGMRFRDVLSLQIDRIFFSTFFGGSGKPPVKTETLSFDNFVVYTYKPAVSIARGNTANPKGTVIPLPVL